MRHTNRSMIHTLALAAGSAALLLLASSALAQNAMMFHGGMSGHRHMGGFSGTRQHSSFAPTGSQPMGPFSAARMPPPPSGMAMPPAPTNGVIPRGTVGTGMNSTNMASTTTFHHRRFFDDDDFFFAAFPFPDPFFVNVVQPVYISPDDAYWYWCPSSQAYFPWVRTCDVPWQPVPAY